MSGAGPQAPLVVKLGGSLSNSDQLPVWLEAIRQGAGRVVLVPGGGPFADQVRHAQARWGFDDSTAHRLALLAMEQFGYLLAGLCDALEPVADRASLESVRRRGAVPVWLPTDMVLATPEIAHSWDVTSDSLAAWLAGRLGRADLVLVKSAALPAGPADAATLSAGGFVDPAFPASLARAASRAWCFGPRQQEQFGALLAGAPLSSLAISD